jgi:hypothetical protein
MGKEVGCHRLESLCHQLQDLACASTGEDTCATEAFLLKYI